MTKDDKIRQTLEQRRDKLQRTIAGLQGEEAAETSGGQTDNAHEWENADVREDLVRDATGQLEVVELALARIRDGSYGICASCGKPIGAKRLEAMPEAESCIECAEKEG